MKAPAGDPYSEQGDSRPNPSQPYRPTQPQRDPLLTPIQSANQPYRATPSASHLPLHSDRTAPIHPVPPLCQPFSQSTIENTPQPLLSARQVYIAVQFGETVAELLE